jgi:L-rhamnose mutarotase
MNSIPLKFLWVTGLKREKAATYRDLHAAPWPGVTQMLAECNICEFTLFEKEIEGKLYLFAHVEYTGSDFEADMAKLASDPETQRWWALTDPCQEPLPDAVAKGKVWSEASHVFALPKEPERGWLR